MCNSIVEGIICTFSWQWYFHLTLPDKLAAKADNILKASYFLEVSKPFFGSRSLLEKQIENEMVSRIKEVIMMLKTCEIIIISLRLYFRDLFSQDNKHPISLVRLKSGLMSYQFPTKNIPPWVVLRQKQFAQ